jgi:DNA-directed RNA polymerase specialized sigma subunit
LRQNIARAENDLTQRFQHPPTVSEIAEYLDVPPNEVSDAILASESLRLQSLEQVIENDDCLGGPDPGIQRIEGTALIGQVLDAIAQLNEKDKKLIQLYYFENKNQAEIARIMDINQVQVARLLKRTIKKIREIILSSAHQL